MSARGSAPASAPATIRTVVAQPDAERMRAQWRRVRDGFAARVPRLATLLDEAETDVLASLDVPSEPWR